MKIINRFALIIGLAGILLLTVLFFTNFLSIGNLVVNGISLISLLVAGIALILAENASGLVKYMVIFAAWTGFLILAAAAYQFIELNACWQLGFFLLALALVSGISHRLSFQGHNLLKWTGIISAILLLIFLTGILFKIENNFIYRSTTLLLVIFSVISITGTFVRPKLQG